MPRVIAVVARCSDAVLTTLSAAEAHDPAGKFRNEYVTRLLWASGEGGLEGAHREAALALAPTLTELEADA